MKTTGWRDIMELPLTTCSVIPPSDQSPWVNISGDNETVPITLTASVPTGEIKQVGSLPLAVTREAYVSDFSGTGGIVKILIAPNGHDTWKISKFFVDNVL